MLNFGRINSFAGVDIVETADPSTAKMDWSACRSPSRAKRRHKRGYPQHVIISYVSFRIGNVIYMHPSQAAKVREQVKLMARDIEVSMERRAYAAICGGQWL